MTTPNTIIADLSHEIDRLKKVSNLLLIVAIRSKTMISDYYHIFTIEEQRQLDALLGDLRYAIEEAHHG